MRTTMGALVLTAFAVLGQTGQQAQAATGPDSPPGGSEAARPALRQLIAAAARRHRGLGSPVGRADLRAVPGPAGDPSATWIVPRGTGVPRVGAGDHGVTVRALARPQGADGPARRGEAGRWRGGGPRVVWQSAMCRSRWDETLGWFDTCGQFARVTRTRDRRWHWIFRQYGTCRSHGGFRLTACRLATDRNRTGPRLRWDDWSPRGDSDGACRDISLTVSVVGLGIGGAFSACETIDVRKFSRPGHLAVTWRGWAARTDREVASQIAFSSGRGSIPVLSASWHLAGVVAL